MATTLLHDSVNRRQAQSGRAAALLGGEEGLEDAADRFAVHAAAAVGYRQLHIRPWLNIHVLAGVGFAQLDVGRLDFQAPA